MKSRLRVVSIFGTRPEAIKMAPVVLELERHGSEIDSTVVVTGQHRDILDQILEGFGIAPDIDLNLMRPNQTLSEIVSRAVCAVDEVLGNLEPDVVLVQGDTSTALASALAAFHRKVRVAHVEAGLRTHDALSPFPEEMNRRLISSLALLHFAPTQCAVEALLAEGVPRTNVWRTGNTGIDALHIVLRRPELGRAPRVGEGRRLVLVTAHRRESFGAPMLRVCEAVRRLVSRNPDVEVLFPVHPNPNVHDVVYAQLGKIDRVRLEKPMGYFDFVRCMERAHLLVTDSGGLQEEACAIGKPTLILRDNTERPEVVDAGVAQLVGTDVDRIVANAERLLKDPELYRRMARPHDVFGDGTAAHQIALTLLSAFG